MSTALAASPAAPPPEAPPQHPIRNRRFLTWWLGATVSLFGDQFYFVALPWLVLQLTGSALAMGGVSMAAGIPRALLMLFGGAVTDRTSPRRLLMATASARAALVGTIGVLAALNALALWHLYVLAFAFGLADAFALPAAGPLLRSLVEPRQLPAANSVWQSSALLTGIVGPAPAGLVMKSLGVAWAFVLDAVSFLFLIGALLTLPDPPRTPSAQHSGMLRSIGEGLAYVTRDVALRSLVLLAAVLNFCLAGPLSVGLAYLAKQRFSSPASFGVWISSVAMGTLAGMLLAGVFRSKRRGVLLVGTGIALGAATACLGLLPGLWPVAALLSAMGALSGFLNVQLQAWFQARVEPNVLGRVGSVMMLSAFGLAPLSMGLAGAVVGWSATGLFAMAGAAVAVVSAFAALHRDVRNIA